MRSRPSHHPPHDSPALASHSSTAIAFASVAVLALAGVLVLVAAMPRWSLLAGLLSVPIVAIGARLQRFDRFAIPTGTVHVCVPFLGICIEGRVRQRPRVGE